MTEVATSAGTEAARLKFELTKDLSTVTTSKGIKVDIMPDGYVVVYTDAADGIQTNPAIGTSAAATEDNQFSVSKDFNTVSMYGTTISLAADGQLTIATDGTVMMESVAAGQMVPGDKADDGWTYIGRSPDTHKAAFLSPEAPEDENFISWNAATEAAKALQEQGKTEARLPSMGELSLAFNIKAKIGGAFDKFPLWSSETDGSDNKFAKVMSLNTGEKGFNGKDYKVSVSARFVRS